MQKTCLQCSSAFTINQDDQKFLDIFQVPAPTTCSDCRLLRRLCERNTRSLYYRKCDLSGKQIISQYKPESPFPVYGIEEWISDRWDGLSYGRAFDFSRPFFEQFHDLVNLVPHLSLFNTPGTMENSDFNNCTGYLKNCYLLSESDYCEDSYYSNLLKKSKDVVDCSVCYECERCYECIDCISCHSLLFSQDCHNCCDSYFLVNCHSCKDCIGCINQRNKQYMIANIQYSKEEYEEKRQELQLDTRSGLRVLAGFCCTEHLKHPFRSLMRERAENCTGDRLYDCKNAYQCFDCKDIEDCRYCQRLSLTCKTCMDFNSWGQNSELMYQCSATGDRAYNSKFCSTCITIANCEYCFECFHCSDCFGCVGLKQKRFCIFNTQYNEESYRKKRAEIIAHMRKTAEYGEFFPMSLCAFSYNETFASDLFPLTKEAVLARGWKWHEEAQTENRYMGAAVALPEKSSQVSDDITKQILICKNSGKAYKIIPQELRFYRSMNIPLPELCPDERHFRRISKRNLYKLWQRQCAKCQKEIDTTYAPDRPEIVYCEECYLKEIY